MTPSFKSQQDKKWPRYLHGEFAQEGSCVLLCLVGTAQHREFSVAPLCQGVSLGVHRSLFSVMKDCREQQKNFQINYCYFSHKKIKKKFLWLYCADSCAVPERLFQKQERRTDSLHKAIRADNPQEVIM